MPEGFQWVNHGDWERSTASFLRLGPNPKDTYAVIGNFTPVMRDNYCLGVPYGGHWQEVINTNAEVYGGSGIGNFGGVSAQASEADGRDYSLRIELPPLSTVIFQYQG